MAWKHFITYASSLLISAVMVITASANPEYEQPKLQKENLLSIVGIQGLVYCKTGPKVTPLEGSVARITCEAVDEYGFETAPINILSDATDARGYFLATISPFEIQNKKKKITQCKAFLELSPLDSCNVPTDANNGISGALLTSCHLLHENNMKLFTVGPFVFTSESKPSVKVTRHLYEL